MENQVLILGGTGFIGINLTYYLLKNTESEITVFGRRQADYPSDLLNHPRVRIVTGIFAPDYEFGQLMKGYDMVYHLISTTVPTTSNQNISKEIVDNIESTSVLLDACVKNHVKKIVFISSGGTVYGITENQKISENMPTDPITSYGLQKLTIEKLLYLYYYMKGLDYRIIRLSNPYGPFQKVNGIQGVISTFIFNVLNDRELIVYGDGSVVRDYLYIDDAIQAIARIAGNDAKKKVYNVGSGHGLSINEIIEGIRLVVGKNIKLSYRQGRKVDVPVNILDVSRYENEFGKLSNTELLEGIQKTASFIQMK